MSSRAQHYRQAERILADIADFDEKGVWAARARERALKESEIRAHLANVGDETYNEALEARAMELAPTSTQPGRTSTPIRWISPYWRRQ